MNKPITPTLEILLDMSPSIIPILMNCATSAGINFDFITSVEPVTNEELECMSLEINGKTLIKGEPTDTTIYILEEDLPNIIPAEICERIGRIYYHNLELSKA